jgi:hypothetical protein
MGENSTKLGETQLGLPLLGALVNFTGTIFDRESNEQDGSTPIKSTFISNNAFPKIMC